MVEKADLKRVQFEWRHDFQHNDTLVNDTLCSGIQHNDSLDNGIQSNEIKHNGFKCEAEYNVTWSKYTHYNDTQHNDTQDNDIQPNDPKNYYTNLAFLHSLC